MRAAVACCGVSSLSLPTLALSPGLVTWSLEIGFIAYAIVITVVVLLERRRPTATLALILALVFLPVVGLLVYLLLGRRAKRRQSVRRRRIVRPFDEMRDFAAAARLPEDTTAIQRSLVQLAMATAAAPVRHASLVELFADPRATFAAMHAAIDSAESYLHVMFYIWRDDATGRELVARLAARAHAGIKVRVLLDHLGSFGVDDDHFAPLLEAGGELGWFGRLRFPWRPWRSKVNFRNHRKILVVDGERGFIGGINVGDEYSGAGTATRGWRDIMVEIHGDAVVGLDAVFLDDWLVSTGQVIDVRGTRTAALAHIDARRPARRRWIGRRERPAERALRTHNPFGALPPRTPADDGPLVQIVPSGPDAPVAQAIATQITAAIAGACDRAWIVTPYFVPDEPLLAALRTAALRGVDVRVIVPSAEHNDSRLVALAAASYYDDLLDAGARVFEYQAGMLHAKYAVFDDVSLVGSANMDVRSFHLNYEIIAMFYDAGVTAGVVSRFSEDLTDSREITAEQREALSWPSRVLEASARVMSPLL
jgi:cardiolipin synthase